jgi:hypothetical protein
MNRCGIITTTFADCKVVEEIDNDQEDAGDEFACFEDHDCIDPRGHLFFTCCGETKCVHCGRRISWI